MITTEETAVQVTRRVYTAPAPDTSNITVSVEEGVATITYGGSSLVIPVDALPTLTALVATVGAAIEPVAPPAETEAAPVAIDAPTATA